MVDPSGLVNETCDERIRFEMVRDAYSPGVIVC